MKKEKSNGIVVIIMGLIIIVLLIVCYLFASNTIAVEEGKIVTKKDTLTAGKEPDQSKEETTKNLSKEEAIQIVSTLFENKEVRRIIDNDHLPYCAGNSGKVYSEQELGLNYVFNGLGYTECDGTYEDVINYIKTYFTDEYFKNNLENKKTIATKSFKDQDGIEKYNYYEKDGKLYIVSVGKGGDLGKVEHKTPTYNITAITENKIEAIVNVVWLYPDDLESDIENVKISVEKEDGTWKISEYNLLYRYGVSNNPYNIKQK